jgi:hypothetical protein
MASGAPTPGGLKLTPPGGLQEAKAGGIQSDNYRIFQGHPDADPGNPLTASGARTAVTRRVVNIRRDAKTTNVTYAWTVPTVPGGSTTAAGSVTGGTTATAAFTPDVAGTYVFRCVVTFVRTGGNITKTINFSYTSA